MSNPKRLKAICDAGPIIHLDELKVLRLLTDFNEVLVPDRVWIEVTRHRREALNHPDVPFRKVALDKPPDGLLLAMSKAFSLDSGEMQALSLASQHKDFLLFTDDAAARFVAEQMGFKVHGTIGIIVRAIRRGYLSAREVVEILSIIPEQSSLYIKPALLDKIMRDLKKNFEL